jgi:seryl-tRNA synthetase
MIDIKFLRENPDVVRASQKARGEDDAIVEKALKADEVRKSSLDQFETLRAEQNLLSKSVASAKGEEKTALLESAKALAAKVKEADSKRAQAEIDAKALIMQISNVLDPQAPIGKEDDFVVIENVGKPRVFDFQPKDHVELGKLLGAIDTERGAKVAGSRSYYLTGVGAMLEFALVNFAITSANKAGFTPVIPPVLVNSAAMEGTGFLGQAAENVYHLEKDDVYLVGTSEVPLAAMHMDEVLVAEKLPLRYAGYSTCFRREAGTYGKDTRGIIRVHQFDKVEMFSFCHPDQAKEEHQRLLQWEKDFLNAMEIPYRVIDVASGDLGSSANRKFDIEAWDSYARCI